jgi:hypothetical protein
MVPYVSEKDELESESWKDSLMMMETAPSEPKSMIAGVPNITQIHESGLILIQTCHSFASQRSSLTCPANHRFSTCEDELTIVSGGFRWIRKEVYVQRTDQ